MPGPRECRSCGGVHRDYGQRDCRQCRLRPQQCPVCSRLHRSDRRKCSACTRAMVGLTAEIGHHRHQKGAIARMVARRQRIEAAAALVETRGPAELQAQRRVLQRERGIRICANLYCQREHRNRTAALCRQCRLVDHAACAECSKPFRGEPSARRCNSCRQRARRRARSELSHLDATGDLDTESIDVV